MATQAWGGLVMVDEETGEVWVMVGHGEDGDEIAGD